MCEILNAMDFKLFMCLWLMFAAAFRQSFLFFFSIGSGRKKNFKWKLLWLSALARLKKISNDGLYIYIAYLWPYTYVWMLMILPCRSFLIFIIIISPSPSPSSSAIFLALKFFIFSIYDVLNSKQVCFRFCFYFS